MNSLPRRRTNEKKVVGALRRAEGCTGVTTRGLNTDDILSSDSSDEIDSRAAFPMRFPRRSVPPIFMDLRVARFYKRELAFRISTRFARGYRDRIAVFPQKIESAFRHSISIDNLDF